MKSSVAHRAVAAKCQVHEVGRALDLLREFAVLKTADQMGAAVEAVVDVQEIVVGLDAEAATSYKKDRKPIKKKTVVFCKILNTSADWVIWNALRGPFKKRVHAAAKGVMPSDLFCISRQSDKKRYLPQEVRGD